MTVRQDLSRAREVLAAGHIEDPSLEAELLLKHALKIDRVQLYLELDCQLTPNQSGRFWQLLQRRLDHEPSAYITGHREFYGLDFYIDSSVLIPRPETELLVEQALELVHPERSRRTTIADIGTGCGAIAISLALKLPRAKIYATDISTAALKVAAANCRKHGVADRVYLLEGDLLDPLSQPVDLIVANLPYVRESELGGVNTRGFEPVLALNGGSDGLEKIRRLCSQLTRKLRPGGSLLLEIGQGQAEAVTAFLHYLFPSASFNSVQDKSLRTSPSAQIEVIPDLAGIERVVGVIL